MVDDGARGAQPVRALVVDDHPIFRLGLRRALVQYGIEIVAEAEDGPSAIRLFERTGVDVVLLDAALPGVDGFTVCRQMLATRSDMVILIVSSFDDAASVRSAKRAGARAHIAKDTRPSDIARVVRAALSNPTWTSFEGLGTVLTDREHDVLVRYSLGLGVRDTAEALGISVETVRSYTQALYAKLGVGSRLEAITAGRSLGLLPNPPGPGVPKTPE